MSKAIKFQVAASQEATGEPYHFFLSSIGEWRTGDNLEELISQMKKGGLPFSAFKVPGGKDEPYEIRYYAPNAPGTVFIGHWGFDVKGGL